MAYGSYSRNAIQLGRETTAGTAVAATEIWRGEFAMLENTQAREVVTEQVGLFVSPERNYLSWLGGTLAMPSTPMTFEQLPHLLEAGLLTVSPSGAGPYVYDYVVDATAAPTIKTYTVETGNADITGDNHEMPYSFVKSFKLSGDVKSPWMMESTWMGQQLTKATNTTGLSLLAVEEVLFSTTALTIDASGGTIGTGTFTNPVLMSAEINFTDTGVMEVPAASGNNYFTAIKYKAPEATFSLTFELEDGDAAVAAARTAYTAGTSQLIQMTMAGTSSREVRIRFSGLYDSVSSYDNADGNTTVTVAGRVEYNSTDAQTFECKVTNNRASL